MERPTPPPSSADDLLRAKRHLMLLAERRPETPPVYARHPFAAIAIAFGVGFLLLKTPGIGSMIKGTTRLTGRAIFDAIIFQALRIFTGDAGAGRR